MDVFLAALGLIVLMSVGLFTAVVSIGLAIRLVAWL
jgi:hypothetical protein